MPAPASISPTETELHLPGGARESRRDQLIRWLASAPLVPPALGLAVGITVDAVIHIPVPVAVLLFVACGVLLRMKGSAPPARHLLLAVAAAAVGTVLHDQAMRRWPGDHIVRCCGAEPGLARVTGVVIGAPVTRMPSPSRMPSFADRPTTRFILQAQQVDGRDGAIETSGLVSVLVRDEVPGLRGGDRVTMLGTLARQRGPSNPGERDWRLLQRRRGVLVQMTCEGARSIRPLEGGAPLSRWLNAWRRRAVGALVENTFVQDTPGAQLLETLVLGQRSAISPELTDAFVRTGTVHYLSVSGSHVGMLAGFIWGLGILVGRSRRECALSAMLFVTLYCILVEPSAPVIRSVIMGDLLCIAILLRRPLRTANWLALSAVVLLVCAPTQLFDAGFQLSFGTLIGLIYLSPRVHRAGRCTLDILLRRTDPLLQPEIQNMLNPPGRLRRSWQACVHVLGWFLAVSIAAWLVGTLPSAYHFRQLSLWGWANTIVIMPVVSVVLVLGLLKTLVASVSAQLGAVLAPLLTWCTDWLIRIVETLARLPISGHSTPAIPLWLVFAGLGVLFAWAAAPWLRLRPRHLAAGAGAWVIAAVIALAPSRPHGVELTVLAVGDGACTVLRGPDGSTMVYDMGSRPPYDLDRWTLGPFLSLERVRTIDQLVLSHADMDHVCGVPELLERRKVSALVISPHFARLARSDAAREIIDKARSSGIAVQIVPAAEIPPGLRDAKVDVLWPPAGGRLGSNDSSIVLRITYAGRRILLTGDITDVPQRELLDAGDLKADVLILPHHGGVTSLTGDFIRAVDPQICIRSSGQRDGETRTRLPDLVQGRRYYSTADDGAVCVRITPQGELEVRRWRDRDDP